jgi:hypothetical protein
VIAALAAAVFLRCHEQSLMAEAERAIPGSINGPRAVQRSHK